MNRDFLIERIPGLSVENWLAEARWHDISCFQPGDSSLGGLKLSAGRLIARLAEAG